MAVVTDSTACLPGEVAQRQAITVVPLDVVLGSEALTEAQVDPDALLEAIRRRSRITTSRPSPQRFATVFDDLAAAGATGVVSVHLSAQASGTVDAASLAAADAALPVRVVDSRQLGYGVGLSALAAARCAAAGGDLDAVAAVAVERAAATRTVFCVDTLEYLRRGGRIGPAAALIGSALAVKPLLHIVDGQVVLLEKVRTTARARARLVEIAVATITEMGAAVVAVQHLGAGEVAGEIAEEIRTRTGLAHVPVLPVGAVVGAHVGPGAIGIVVGPTDPV